MLGYDAFFHTDIYVCSDHGAADLSFHIALAGAPGGASPGGVSSCQHHAAEATADTSAAMLAHQSPCTQLQFLRYSSKVRQCYLIKHPL